MDTAEMREASMDAIELETRRALYYPFIHPRDPNWVKATILAFGQLTRIVPPDFTMQDVPEVAELAQHVCPGGPLVDSISADYHELYNAQGRLHQALQSAEIDVLRARFGAESAFVDGGRSPALFHAGKFNGHFLEWLCDNGLAWPSSQISAELRPKYEWGEWYAVHRSLGDAVISVIAIAAARDRGLDIVTDSAPLHSAVATLEEEHVIQALLGMAPIRPAVSRTQAASQLVHIVLTTGFDVSQLSVYDVASLVRDGMDLRRFKEAAARMAITVPADAAEHIREARLRELAAEMLEQWEQYTRGLTPRLRSIIVQSGKERAKKLFEDVGGMLTAAVAGGAAGASQGTLQGLAVGFAIGVVAHGVGALLTRSTDPLRYLSKVERAGAVLVAGVPSTRHA
jgi:hypothetical protein